MMKKQQGTRELALGGYQDQISSRTIEQAGALNSWLAKLKREMRPTEYILAERQAGRAAIVEETARLRQERRAVLAQGLEDARERWTRDYYADLPRRDFDLRLYEKKLAAASQDDLERAAQDFATGAELPDPNMIYVLGARLNEVGLNVHREFVKQRATQRRSLEPWTKGEGAPLYDELKRLETAKPDDVLIGLEAQGGQVEVTPFSLDSFIDEVGADK